MKKILANILCSTAITLIILAILGAVSGAQFLLIHSVFQSFIVNIVIHIGLLFTRKFESTYVVLEFMLDIGYVVVAVIIFGAIFNWYASIPVWVLAVMTTIIYFVAILLNMNQVQQEIEEIDKLLQKRNNTTSKE